MLSSYVSEKPASSLHLWPADEAPTVPREVADVPCPRCRSIGIELVKVDGDAARGGRFQWEDCRLCRGTKVVTPSAAVGYRVG